MTHPRIIVGAGLAGLIAAHAWPRAHIVEAAPEPRAGHKALLRFRSDAVARLTGIEFQKVRVHKGLWIDGAYAQPSIQAANLYAQKVTGRVQGDRSIWSLDSVDRYVAPEDLYERLIDQCGARVRWATPFNWAEQRCLAHDPVVSTAPLHVAAQELGVLPEGGPAIEWRRAPIEVHRFRVPGARAYQTVYFPDLRLRVYRASITGDLLIVEYAGALNNRPCDASHAAACLAEVCKAFGIIANELITLDSASQKYGKISPIDEALRRTMLFRLTQEHGIYSLGRFATWRNILLDDVVNDVDVIKRLLRTADAYTLRHSA